MSGSAEPPPSAGSRLRAQFPPHPRCFRQSRVAAMGGASLTDRGAAPVGSRQEQDVLLDVRGEVQQVHDLRHAGAGDVAEAGQLGVVGDLAVVGTSSSKWMRQRHQPGDPGHAARCVGGLAWPSREHLAARACCRSEPASDRQSLSCGLPPS